MSRLDTLQQMLIETPEDPFVHYAIGLEYHKAGELRKGISILEVLLEKHPDYLPCYYQLGQWFEEFGQKEYAIEVYSKGMELARSRGDHKTLGELHEAYLNLE